MQRVIPFPESGWVIGVLVGKTDSRYLIGRLPVVAMHVDDDDEMELIVALQSGQILRTSKTGLDVLCLAAPGEDVEKVALAALAKRFGEIVVDEEVALS